MIKSNSEKQKKKSKSWNKRSKRIVSVMIWALMILQIIAMIIAEYVPGVTDNVAIDSSLISFIMITPWSIVILISIDILMGIKDRKDKKGE